MSKSYTLTPFPDCVLILRRDQRRVSGEIRIPLELLEVSQWFDWSSPSGDLRVEIHHTYDRFPQNGVKFDFKAETIPYKKGTPDSCTLLYKGKSIEIKVYIKEKVLNGLVRRNSKKNRR